jgi:hypothetical protein
MTESSVYVLNGNGNKDLVIISFGGISKQFAGTPPFEFLRFLHQTFPQYDKYFYIDLHQNWYHQGIAGFSTNVEETRNYLQTIIRDYNSVLFVGVSAGGYAAILFGSLLKVTSILAFIPQTRLRPYENGREMDSSYLDLRNYMTHSTQYYIYGNPSILNKDDHHHISQCEHIADFPNVHLTLVDNLNLPEMRDNGELYKIVSEIITLSSLCF